MRAITAYGPRDFRVEDRPNPIPGQGQLLVRPLVNGICFTDKHLFDGHLDRFSRLVIGHEFSAEVVALGDGVSGWKPGDLISVDPRIPCGDCLACRAGLEMLCSIGRFLGVHGADGGLADRCAVSAASCYLLPDRCSPLQAACAEAACCATRAVRSGAFAPADNVVILGLDDYGLYVAQWLKNRGGTIVAIDPNPIRRQAAIEFGADIVLDMSDDVVSAVRKAMPFGADVVVVSLEDYVEQSLEYVAMSHRLARIQGTIVMLRAYGSAPFAQIKPDVPWLKELTIRHFGNFFGNEPARGGRARGDWQVTLDALASGALAAPPPQTRVIGFSDLRNGADVAALFDSLPSQASKILVNMET